MKLISPRYQIHEWFSWFLDDCLAPWKNLSTDNLPPEDTRETLFELGKSYAAIVASDEPFYDHLSWVYMDLASHGQQKVMGQYFTPSPVSELMAMITIGEIDPDRLTRIADGAGCGAGSMLLAAARLIYSQAPAHIARCSFTGIDLDYTCIRMATLQFLANHVIHGCHAGELLFYRGNGLLPITELDVYWHSSHPAIDAADVPPALHPCREAALQHSASIKAPQMEFEF